MYEQQHSTALVAKYEPESDEITFSILRVAGVFHGEYLIVEGNDLKTVEEIDNPESNRAVRLMWQNERTTQTHREELESRLFCRTALVM
jgi:hypothetical protein